MKAATEKLKHSILGLLSIRPMTGYELRKNFDRSLRVFWPVPLTQIYSTLKTMESENLIAGEVILQEKKPSKNVYSLTEKGRRELLKWLENPSKLKIMQHEFLHKLFLYNLLPLKTAIAAIRQYKIENEKLLNHFIGIHNKFCLSLASDYSENIRFQLLSLTHLIRLTEVEIEGAEAIESELLKSSAKDTVEAMEQHSKQQNLNDIIF